MSFERLSLPLQLMLHSLATKVPRIILQRVDEIFPTLKECKKIIGEEMGVPPRAQIRLSSETLKTHCTYKRNVSVEQYSCENSCTKFIRLKGSKNEYQRKAQYFCEVCMKPFGWKSNLNRHIKHVHTAPYMCALCMKGFSVYSDLKNHQCIHTRHLSCGVCNATFLHKKNLMAHRCLIHVTNQTYSSNEYKKSFRENSHLNSNQSLHGGKPTEEYSYSCNICKESFRNKSSLINHKHTHTSKPAVCDICRKSFSSSGYVLLHKRIHNGEQPYSCNICLMTFTFKNNLEVHTLKYHS